MKPTKQQTWIGVVMLALPMVAGLLGVKYEQANPTIESTVKVDITALPTGAIRSDQDVKALCKEITKAALDFHVNKSGRH